VTVQVNMGDGWEDLDLDVEESREPLWAEKRDKIVEMYDYRAVNKK